MLKRGLIKREGAPFKLFQALAAYLNQLKKQKGGIVSSNRSFGIAAILCVILDIGQLLILTRIIKFHRKRCIPLCAELDEGKEASKCFISHLPLSKALRNSRVQN